MLGDIYLIQKKQYKDATNCYEKALKMINSRLDLLDPGSDESEINNMKKLKVEISANEQRCILVTKTQSGMVDQYNTSGLLPADPTKNEWNTPLTRKGPQQNENLNFVPPRVKAEKQKSKRSGAQADNSGDDKKAEKEKKKSLKPVKPPALKKKKKEKENPPAATPATEQSPATSSKIKDDKGIYSVTDDKLIFQFFKKGKETSFKDFTKSKPKGWHLPSPEELNSVLTIIKENNNPDLFGKFAWKKRGEAHFLTNSPFLDKNNNQVFKTFLVHKPDHNFQESSVPISDHVFIILIKD
ncbi:MAG: hypothetical protein NTU44_06270 [Bacteroidetes bacterium]|nr:hypothetical protein [Bacteroidota bacterium]